MPAPTLRRLGGSPLIAPRSLDAALEWWARRPPRQRQLAAVFAALCMVAVVLHPRPHPWGATLDVVVAVRQLEPGQSVGPSDVELRSWPRALAPASAITVLDAAVGADLAHRVPSGAAVTTVHLGQPSPADLAPGGWVATALPVDTIGTLGPGTVIDLHGGDGSTVPGALVLATIGGDVWLAVRRDLADDLARALAWGDVQVAVWAPTDSPP